MARFSPYSVDREVYPKLLVSVGDVQTFSRINVAVRRGRGQQVESRQS